MDRGAVLSAIHRTKEDTGEFLFSFSALKGQKGGKGDAGKTPQPPKSWAQCQCAEIVCAEAPTSSFLHPGAKHYFVVTHTISLFSCKSSKSIFNCFTCINVLPAGITSAAPLPGLPEAREWLENPETGE